MLISIKLRNYSMVRFVNILQTLNYKRDSGAEAAVVRGQGLRSLTRESSLGREGARAGSVRYVGSNQSTAGPSGGRLTMGRRTAFRRY